MKKLLLLSMCSLLLAGCSSQSSSEDSKEEKVDAILDEYEEEKVDMGMSAEWDGVNYENSIGGVAQTTDGYYFFMPTEMKIAYISKNTKEVVPLCTQPDCDHYVASDIVLEEGERYEYKCDAVYNRNRIVQVYNGKLYADMEYLDAEGAHPLMCANLDGTNKTEVIHDTDARKWQELEKLENGSIPTSCVEWIIYKDKIYILTVMEIYAYSPYERIEPEERYYIDEYDLMTGEFIREVASWSTEEIKVMNEMMCINNDKIQLSMYVFGSVEQGRADDRVFYSVDIETGEIETINPGTAGTYFGYTFIDDKVIYHKNNDDIYSIDANGVTEKCIETNDEEKERKLCIHNVGDFICTSYGSSSADGELEYLVKIYDKEYNLLETVEVPGDIFACAACEDQILLKAFNVDRFYYINTEELGTGNVELHEFSME